MLALGPNAYVFLFSVAERDLPGELRPGRKANPFGLFVRSHDFYEWTTRPRRFVFTQGCERHADVIQMALRQLRYNLLVNKRQIWFDENPLSALVFRTSFTALKKAANSYSRTPQIAHYNPKCSVGHLSLILWMWPPDRR